MDITVMLGWWLVPAAFTLLILLAWRIWGIRMQPNNGSMFPDAAGALFELLGYVVALLLASIAWLIWALLR